MALPRKGTEDPFRNREMIHGVRKVETEVYDQECGQNCLAALEDVSSGCRADVECGVLNAMLAGDRNETEKRIIEVRGHFSGDFCCAVIRVFEALLTEPLSNEDDLEDWQGYENVDEETLFYEDYEGGELILEDTELGGGKGLTIKISMGDIPVWPTYAAQIRAGNLDCSQIIRVYWADKSHSLLRGLSQGGFRFIAPASK